MQLFYDTFLPSEVTTLHTSEISSSGCTSLMDIPELDSGFLMVGAADIVALADIDVEVGAEAAADAEYAGNVGRTGPDVGCRLEVRADRGRGWRHLCLSTDKCWAVKFNEH